MGFLVGWLVSILTFPGHIMHTVAQRIACDMMGIPVFKAKYYRNPLLPAGYLVHGPIATFREGFVIWMAPVVLNTILCSAITLPAIFPMWFLDIENPSVTMILLFWCGISIGMHAFPKPEEAKTLFANIENPRGFFITSFRFIISMINFLKYVWLDLIYAVGVSLVVPALIIHYHS